MDYGEAGEWVFGDWWGYGALLRWVVVAAGSSKTKEWMKKCVFVARLAMCT